MPLLTITITPTALATAAFTSFGDDDIITSSKRSKRR